MKKRKSTQTDEPEPIRPSDKQIRNSQLMNWEYDEESYLFERDGVIACFTEQGFVKI